jgi:hypothetical protein
MTISRADIDGLVSKLTAHAGDIPSMIRDDERKRGFAIVLPGEVGVTVESLAPPREEPPMREDER